MKKGLHLALWAILVFGILKCDAPAPAKSSAPPPALGQLKKVDTVGGVLNVSLPPYGAVPGQDAYPAIQAAIDHACQTALYVYTPVYIPEGVYPLSQPLRLDCFPNVGNTPALTGASRTGTVLQPMFNGPAIVVQQSVASGDGGVSPGVSLTLGPALVGPPTGSSMVQATTSRTRVDLRAIPAAELDGLRAFTAAFSL